MILIVIFWVLFALWLIGLFAPLDVGTKKAHSLIPAILIGILGLKAFGSPLK